MKVTYLILLQFRNNYLYRKPHFYLQCVIGDGQYGTLLMVKDINTIHTLQQNVPPDVKVTIRYFQMQNDVLMTDTSEIEVDDEVNTSFLFIIITAVLEVLNLIVKCVSLFILEHSNCNKS